MVPHRGTEFADWPDEDVIDELIEEIEVAVKFIGLTRHILRFLPGFLKEMMVHEVRAEYRERTNPLIAEATRRQILPENFPMV